MAEEFAHLFEPPDGHTYGLVRSILDRRGIPFRTREQGVPPTVFGFPGDPCIGPDWTIEILVPRERLQEAGELLGEDDIICEISPETRRRCFESIAAPLAAGSLDDLGRLVRFLRINNLSPVEAILEDLREAQGGPRLLLVLFFRLLRGDEPLALQRLTRFLNRRPPGGMRDIVAVRLGALDPVERRNLAAALERLRAIRPGPILVSLLRDRDGETREAAIEALFTLFGKDLGYDPEAPEEEREAAVRRWEETL